MNLSSILFAKLQSTTLRSNTLFSEMDTILKAVALLASVIMTKSKRKLNKYFDEILNAFIVFIKRWGMPAIPMFQMMYYELPGNSIVVNPCRN